MVPFMILRSRHDHELEHLLNTFENACHGRGSILEMLYLDNEDSTAVLIRYEDNRGARIRFENLIKQSTDV